MHIGRVTANREVIIRIKIKGPSDVTLEIEAMLDTGFSEFLCVPFSCVAALSLPQVSTQDLELADGGIVPVDVYRAVVIWDGLERVTMIHCGAPRPLMGMGLLFDHLVTIEAKNGGEVSIVPIS